MNVIDRTPPQDQNAEACVVGAMLLDPSSIERAARMVRVEHFFRPAHQRIFACVLDMFRTGKPVDMVTLNAQLRAKDWLESVGGMDYPISLVNGTPGSANLEHYAGIVLDMAGKRDMIRFADELMARAYDPTVPASAALSMASERIYALHDANRPGGRPVTIAEAADEAIKGERPPSVKTGFRGLDWYSGGLQSDDYAILAGPTGSGKTSLATCIAANVAAAGKRVLYVTLEMHHSRLANRMLAGLSGIPSNCIRDHRLGETDRQTLSEVRAKIANWGIQLERPSTVSEIAGSARAMSLHGGLDLIIIDHLQLISGPGSSRYDEFTRISRDLKMLTASLTIPVLALAQLRRPPEQGKGNWRPHKGALKESGGLENDADHVWLLWRPEDAPILADRPNAVYLKIDKQRDGITTVWADQIDPCNMNRPPSITFDWTPQLTLFKERDTI